MNYVNHLTNMKEIFCPFVEASGITDFDSLFDQMLVEQFLTSLPANVRSFVRSKEPKNHKSVHVMQSFAMKLTDSERSQ